MIRPHLLIDISCAELGVPIRPVNAVAVDTVHSSALILIDTFHDVHGGKHYRIIRVPDEVRREVHVGEDHDDHQLVLGQRSCRSPVVAIRSDGRRVMNATWHAQVSPSSTIMPIDDILNDLNDYLEHCGGRREDSMRIAECWHFMNREARTADDRASVRSMLPPGEGAVWREIVSRVCERGAVQNPSFKEDIVYSTLLPSRLRPPTTRRRSSQAHPSRLGKSSVSAIDSISAGTSTSRRRPSPRSTMCSCL